MQTSIQQSSEINNGSSRTTNLLDEFEVIEQGAEGRIFKGIYLGKHVIAKQRFSKKYRNPFLDQMLTKERMKAECRAIMKCKSVGISSPCIYLVDFDRRIIIMQYYQHNIKVKDFIEMANEQQREWLADQIGVAVGKMHAHNITHGDLTSSNMLLVSKTGNTSINSPDLELVIIDYGLSHTETSIEDKGVDLYVLERALSSTHSSAEDMFPLILEGYRKANSGGYKRVKAKYDEVRARGRKRTMVG